MTTVTLTWTEAIVKDELLKGYRVYRGLGGPDVAELSLISTELITRDMFGAELTHPLSYVDTITPSLSPDDQVTYRVDAFDMLGRVGVSNLATYVQTQAPVLPAVIEDVTVTTVITGASQWTVSLPVLESLDTVADDAVLVICLSARRSSSTPSIPASITYGGIAIDPTSVFSQITAVQSGTGFIHSIIALVYDTKTQQPADDLLSVDWNGSAETTIGVTAITLSNVGDGIEGFGFGFDDAAAPPVASLPALAVQDQDIVLAMGAHYNATPNYTNQSAQAYTQIAASGSFYVNHRQHAGYRSIPADGNETVSSTVNFVTGFGVVVRGQ